jgi:Uma2 family endonuclease
MNKQEIGLSAGLVFQILSDNAKWSYKDLKQKSKLNDKELGATLGWLARENKIEFEQTEEELFIYLCVNVYIG